MRIGALRQIARPLKRVQLTRTNVVFFAGRIPVDFPKSSCFVCICVVFYICVMVDVILEWVKCSDVICFRNLREELKWFIFFYYFY